jgi:hypothetical protein
VNIWRIMPYFERPNLGSECHRLSITSSRLEWY